MLISCCLMNLPVSYMLTTFTSSNPTFISLHSALILSLKLFDKHNAQVINSWENPKVWKAETNNTKHLKGLDEQIISEQITSRCDPLPKWYNSYTTNPNKPHHNDGIDQMVASLFWDNKPLVYVSFSTLACALNVILQGLVCCLSPSPGESLSFIAKLFIFWPLHTLYPSVLLLALWGGLCPQSQGKEDEMKDSYGHTGYEKR